MQKQLKILDEQLNSNNLTRVPSAANKAQKSIFRGLSLSIFFSQEYIDEIIRILRVCLVSSCKSINSSFPSPHRKARFLTKFAYNQQSLDMYFQNPDANCFAYDNFELASLAFKKRLILFTVTKDGYLQQNLVNTNTQKASNPPIMLAKVTNRYFCVQSQSIRSVMMFIKQNIINRLVNLQQDKKQGDKAQQYGISYQNHQKLIKKSLSDCGDILQYDLGVQQRNQQAYVFQDPTHNLHVQKYQLILLYSYHYQGYDEYLYSSQYMMSEPKMQRLLLPNQRYTGRLKFFDQNGNYGFIVVDGFGSDLFVHFDDLQKMGIGKDRLLNIRNTEQMRFQFTCLQYDGKYKKSKKAVDLKQISNQY